MALGMNGFLRLFFRAKGTLKRLESSDQRVKRVCWDSNNLGCFPFHRFGINISKRNLAAPSDLAGCVNYTGQSGFVSYSDFQTSIHYLKNILTNGEVNLVIISPIFKIWNDWLCWTYRYQNQSVPPPPPPPTPPPPFFFSFFFFLSFFFFKITCQECTRQ